VNFLRGGLSILLAPLLLALSCASPLDKGEQLYREGDRSAALEAWESIPPKNKNHEKAVQRIEEITTERAQLVDRYLRRARYFERKKQLAESLLNYRLALRLQDDEPTLDHVQELARTLVSWKKQYWETFDAAFHHDQLAEAQEVLDLLETFDPFDPELTLKKAQLTAALNKSVSTTLSLGRRHFSSGAYSKAKKAFLEVLKLDPTNESAQGHLAYISVIRKSEQSSGGQHNEAALSKIMATEAEIRAEGLYQNALASERSNAPFRAIRYDVAALREDPTHEGARTHLASVRKKLAPQLEPLIEAGRRAFGEEDLQTALDDWNKALLIAPGDQRLHDYTTRAKKLLEGLERLRTEPLPEVSAQ